jgi:hypothetical protein
VAECRFWVQIQLACQVGQHEKQIADLILKSRLISALQLGAEFARFFVQLIQHRTGIGPVKTNPRGAARQLGGAG